MLGHDLPGRGMDARIGDVVEPVAELPVEVIEVTEAAAEEEVLTDVTERALDLALCLCPIGPTRLREVAVVAGEFQQGAVEDDVAGFGILAEEDGSHAVIEDLFRHAAERLEGSGLAAQQRRQVLMQDEAAPKHAAVTEHKREQPDDPLDPGLVGEHRAEMREIAVSCSSRHHSLICG